MLLFFGVLMSASRPDLKLHLFLLASVWLALCKATGKAVQLLNIILNSFGNQPLAPKRLLIPLLALLSVYCNAESSYQNTP